MLSTVEKLLADQRNLMVRAAVAMILHFDIFCRPSSPLQIRIQDVFIPRMVGKGTMCAVSINLVPTDRGAPSKAGQYDEHVVVAELGGHGSFLRKVLVALICVNPEAP